jgi:hypothetical protein
LVDGVLPTVGPIDADGNYVFSENGFSCSENAGSTYFNRQSYPASVIATVTNTSSNSHTIDVNLVCANTSPGEPRYLKGCEAIAHNNTMRVNVFEP